VTGEARYLEIVQYYEARLAEHGDTHRGVDWPNAHEATTRYRVMLDVIREPRPTPVTLLDFGCGASHLYDFMLSPAGKPISAGVSYSGLDLSAEFVALSRRKHPDITYYHLDALREADGLPDVDYVAMNGVFTHKHGLTYDEMLVFFQNMLEAVFPHVRRGLAVNLMTKHVDWEREDLFHLPFDTLATFLKRSLTRHFVFRNDYATFDYTAYIYREPTHPPAPRAAP
jgi:hypothetical protein